MEALSLSELYQYHYIKQFSKNFYYYVFDMCGYFCLYAWCLQRPEKVTGSRAGVTDSYEAPLWVLEIELGCSARAAGTLSYQVMSSAPITVLVFLPPKI